MARGTPSDSGAPQQQAARSNPQPDLNSVASTSLLSRAASISGGLCESLDLLDVEASLERSYVLEYWHSYHKNKQSGGLNNSLEHWRGFHAIERQKHGLRQRQEYDRQNRPPPPQHDNSRQKLQQCHDICSADGPKMGTFFSVGPSKAHTRGGLELVETSTRSCAPKLSRSAMKSHGSISGQRSVRMFTTDFEQAMKTPGTTSPAPKARARPRQVEKSISSSAKPESRRERQRDKQNSKRKAKPPSAPRKEGKEGGKNPSGPSSERGSNQRQGPPSATVNYLPGASEGGHGRIPRERPPAASGSEGRRCNGNASVAEAPVLVRYSCPREEQDRIERTVSNEETERQRAVSEMMAEALRWAEDLRRRRAGGGAPPPPVVVVEAGARPRRPAGRPAPPTTLSAESPPGPPARRSSSLWGGAAASAPTSSCDSSKICRASATKPGDGGGHGVLRVISHPRKACARERQA